MVSGVSHLLLAAEPGQPQATVPHLLRPPRFPLSRSHGPNWRGPAAATRSWRSSEPSSWLRGAPGSQPSWVGRCSCANLGVQSPTRKSSHTKPPLGTPRSGGTVTPPHQVKSPLSIPKGVKCCPRCPARSGDIGKRCWRDPCRGPRCPGITPLRVGTHRHTEIQAEIHSRRRYPPALPPDSFPACAYLHL